MRTNPTLSLSAIVLALATCGAFTGCQTTGVSRATDTAAALHDQSTALAQLNQQTTAVMAALDGVVQASNVDPRASFRRFRNEVSRTNSRNDAVWQASVTAEARVEDYLRQWETEADSIGNADLRKLSRERREEAKAKLQQLREAETGLRQQYRAFAQNLKDVQGYLNNNLNPSGIVAASDQIASVKNASSKLRLDTDAVIARVNDLKLALSPQQPYKR